MTDKNFNDIVKKFDLDQKEINDIAQDMCKTCTEALDQVVDIISNIMREQPNLNDRDLDYFILNLPIYIYHASTQLERLGLNEDISALKRSSITYVRRVPIFRYCSKSYEYGRAPKCRCPYFKYYFCTSV